MPSLIEGKIYTLEKSSMDLSFSIAGLIIVIQNPSRSQFKTMIEKYKELRGLADSSNLYIWNADDCTHDSMKKELEKQEGITLEEKYCGIYYKNNKLYVDGYQYLNGNYDADPEELYAKSILIHNNSALHLFGTEIILKAKNHHIGV